MTLENRTYVGVDHTEDLTKDVELEFVRRRDSVPIESPEYHTVVNEFYGKSLYLAERFLSGLNGKYHSSFMADFSSDLLQVHLKCCESFGARSSFSTYLYRAARNKMIDLIIKREKEERKVLSIDSFEDGGAHIPDSVRVPDEQVIRGERQGYVNRVLAKAMESLNTQQTRILKMKLEGMKSTEIARALRIPAPTVGSSLFYALKRLRKEIDGKLDYS